MSETQPSRISTILGHKSRHSAKVALINAGLCGKGAAEVLLQMDYWSDKTGDRDGWIHKSYEDWERETGIPERTLREHFTELERTCIEKWVGKSKFYHGKRVLQVRIHWGRFELACQARGLLNAGGKPTGLNTAPKRKRPTATRNAAAGPHQRGTRSTRPAVQNSAAPVTAHLAEAAADSPSAALVYESGADPMWTSPPAVQPQPPHDKAAAPEKPRLTGEAVWEALKQGTHFNMEMESLDRFGYDDYYNPPDMRKPEPGEPERILRDKFGQRPFGRLTEVWLQNGAMQVPVMDIEVATQLACNSRPEDVERIAHQIGYRRAAAQSRREYEWLRDKPEAFFRLPPEKRQGA